MNADVSSPEPQQQQQRSHLNGPVSSSQRANHLSASMAESSVIQSSTSTAGGKGVLTDEERCGQFMSLWRPIMCRNQMYRSHDLSSTGSTAAYLSSLVQQQQEASAANASAKQHGASVNNNNNKIKSDSPANSKSIPVHCVVMSTSTPSYLATDSAWMSAGGAHDTCKSSAGGAGGDAGDRSSDGKDSVDMDSYAIIPASTLFSHIVPTVLRKLGYSDDSIFNATGWLIMKNWRPLSLNLIAASDADTVGTILGELTTVATLRIYIRRNNNSIHTDMKNKVLRWLLAHSQHLVTGSRFPLGEKWQQKVMRGERPSTPSPESRRQFDTWFQQEMSMRPHGLVAGAGVLGGVAGRHGDVKAAAGSPTGLHLADQHPLDLMSHGHAGFPPRVRMRTTFDPEQELPRLQRWFAENQHPTRFQLQLFVQELNALDSRRGRKPLDVSNLVYWFKNARAAYKRAEVRNQSGGSAADADWNGCPSSVLAHEENDSCDDAATRAENEAVDDEADEEEDDHDGGASSVSDRSGSVQAFDHRPLKLEPDLRIDELDDARPDGQPQGNRRRAAPADGEPDDDEDGAASSVDSDSEDNDGDYAENLSMSKSNDREQSESDKSADPATASSSHGAAGGAADCHYRLGDYGAFPLGLGHAQNVLSPHGLVYMTSPYLQGLGSSMGLPVGVGVGSGARALGLESLGLGAGGGSSGGANCADDRRKRNRTFIDPVTEVPRLEHWFSLNTHPSHSLVLRYTEELNRQPYRQKFPKLEPKNVQFWFKNRRAKCKRLKLSL